MGFTEFYNDECKMQENDWGGVEHVARKEVVKCYVISFPTLSNASNVTNLKSSLSL